MKDLTDELRRQIESVRPDENRIKRVWVTDLAAEDEAIIAPWTDPDNEDELAKLFSGEMTLDNAPRLQLMLNPKTWEQLAGSVQRGAEPNAFGIPVVIA